MIKTVRFQDREDLRVSVWMAEDDAMICASESNFEKTHRVGKLFFCFPEIGNVIRDGNVLVTDS